MQLLGVGSAAAFTAVDLVYASRRRSSPIYLVDALAELALIAGWGVAAARSQPRSV